MISLASEKEDKSNATDEMDISYSNDFNINKSMWLVLLDLEKAYSGAEGFDIRDNLYIIYDLPAKIGLWLFKYA